jgi:hypothetical protein
LCVRFRLGEKRVLWEEEILLEECNRSDRFGGSRGDLASFRAHDESRFVAGCRGSSGWSEEFAGG